MPLKEIKDKQYPNVFPKKRKIEKPVCVCQNLMKNFKEISNEDDNKVMEIFRRHTVSSIDGTSLQILVDFESRGVKSYIFIVLKNIICLQCIKRL